MSWLELKLQSDNSSTFFSDSSSRDTVAVYKPKWLLWTSLAIWHSLHKQVIPRAVSFSGAVWKLAPHYEIEENVLAGEGCVESKHGCEWRSFRMACWTR